MFVVTCPFTYWAPSVRRNARTMVSIHKPSFPSHFKVSHIPFSLLNPPPRFFSVSFIVSLPRRKGVKQGKKSRFLYEFSDYSSGIVRMCKRGEREGDQALVEVELLEFMKNSKNPDMFPSKSELIQSGRLDLAEAIEKGGGWMSMGWDDDDDDSDDDSDDDDEGHKVEIEDELVRNREFDFSKNGYEVKESTRGGSELEDHSPEGIFFVGNSSPAGAASSSGQSTTITTADDSGIEGILSRLERLRSLSFGLNVEKNGITNQVSVNLNDDGQSTGIPKDMENSRHVERYDNASLGHQMSAKVDSSYSNISTSSTSAGSWKTWSIQRAGVSITECEAAEIDFGGNTNASTKNTSAGELMLAATDINELLGKTKDLDCSVKEINQSDVKTRLRHLEVELSSVLRSLRSNTSSLSEKAKEHMSEDLRQLSNTTEFQENEMMNAQEKLRSIRSKLAILEGKMTLALADAQKVLDVKQSRIDNANRVLQALRSTCIVWANSGSEVLLVGSFDGWATQRKKEKSSSGVFTLCLKLYPGQYEVVSLVFTFAAGFKNEKTAKISYLFFLSVHD